MKKENRNSECTIKTCVEQLILSAFCIQVSSCHGGEFEGNSCRRLMKDSDQFFRDTKVCLLQRLNSISLGNYNSTIEVSEAEYLCHKWASYACMRVIRQYFQHFFH